MKFKDVNLYTKNNGFNSILMDEKNIFIIDANILIPPDRSKEVKGLKEINFDFFRENWIEPFIDVFKPIGIHESVDKEFESSKIKKFLDSKKGEVPPSIIIYYDSDLEEREIIYRNTIESKIARYTNYNPTIDNRDDRGEVKSLSYIATKKLIYFCSHDSNAIRLVEDSEKLETGLEDITAIKPYEIIYHFIKNGIGNKDNLRSLYKYMYYLTKKDKAKNPSWADFIEGMNSLYS